MITATVEEFHAALKAQGVGSQLDLTFRCPICGTHQSPRDLIAAGAGKDFKDVQKYIGFSCVGRWTNAGPFNSRKRKPDPNGKGCDWTLGGLFTLNDYEVVTPEGKKHPHFQPVTPEEARTHAAKLNQQ